MHVVLLPAGFDLVSVQPGLLLQSLVLPPWVLLEVNGGEGGLLLFAWAAVRPQASSDANTSVEISFVIGVPLSTEFRPQSFAPSLGEQDVCQPASHWSEEGNESTA